MESENFIGMVYDFLVQLAPLFRVVWAVTVLIGITMMVTASVLKKNPERKKSPWIVGGIGLIMVISSGTQLLFSLI